MGLAEDLLRQADYLASYEGSNPSQAALRRAVSTAYYALFHLLIEDAAQRWQGTLQASTGIERAFQHGPMKSISLQFANRHWRDWHGNLQPVPVTLQRVANAFVSLQEERHTADYDNHEQWTFSEVQRVIGLAQSAFQNWGAVRTHPVAGDYLLAMLLNKQRS